MKRLSALILSCVLIVSLTLPAFAVSPEVHSDVGVAKEMRDSIDWKEWAKEVIVWLIKQVDDAVYYKEAIKTVESDFIELSPGTISFNENRNGPAAAIIDIVANSNYRIREGKISHPDMTISVSASCSLLTGLQNKIAVMLISPNADIVINKTLGMNGSALYEVNTTAKMGTYKATFTVTEKQKWTPSVRLYDDAAPSSTRTAGMETFSAGQIVMAPDGNKQYTLPTDSVINAVYGETFTNTAYMMSVEELYDQFWDENLKTHVMRLKDYGVGDSIQVCDTISAVKYEPDKDRTILEFLTKYGTAYWPFDGDLTEEYRAGDEVSFQFQVVKEYDTGSYIFESLDYFQAALNKLDNPEMSLYIADYIAR